MLSLLVQSLLFALCLCEGIVAKTVGPSLQSRLSPNATIAYNTTGAPRWSEFDAPTPGTVVNVAVEKDVQVTVQYCIENNIPFLAQNGAHGWATTFHLNQNGLLINLRGLNSVTFNSARTQATVGGGALIQEVISAAYANNAQVTTGNCNCVGTLGAILGGGYGDLMGQHGFGVDLLQSMNVVLANGELTTITPNDADLWWALRGAAPNFGIVTSAVMQSYPVPQNDSLAWVGGLLFTEDKLEQLIQTMNDLVLQPKMSLFLFFATNYATNPTNYTPEILVSPVYASGNETAAREAFAPILNIGPEVDNSGVVPYTEWNNGGAAFCVKGGLKPSYGAGFQNMVPSTWLQIWQEFKTFVSNPGTGQSTVLLEAYPRVVPREKPLNSASFANREINFNGAAIAWYYNESFTSTAEAFGSSVRDLWRATDGLPYNTTYINFAYGDEALNVVYGSHVPRLQALKQVYDPCNRFNQWFPLSDRPTCWS